MDVLVKEPGKNAKLMSIDGRNLAIFSIIARGDVNKVDIGHGLVMFARKSSARRRLDPNFRLNDDEIIFGTAIFAEMSSEGEAVSIGADYAADLAKCLDATSVYRKRGKKEWSEG